MQRQKGTPFSRIISFAVLSLGVGIVAVSDLHASSYLAILGVAIISIGALFLYITPVEHVPLTLLNDAAEVTVDNIERLISELDLTEPGVYLPPGKVRNEELSLVFIPETLKTTPHTSEELNEKSLTDEKIGAFVTPPGATLSRLFEKELGFSFRKTNLSQIQHKLPRLLVEDMELAQSVEIQIRGNTVSVEIVGSVLDEICRQTDSQPKTHRQVGCLLSSAIACTLAKATGKLVTIQNETRNQETETTHIEYQIFEGETAQFRTMQLSPLPLSDKCARLIDTEVKDIVSENSVLDVLNVAIAPNAIKSSVNDRDESNALDVEIAANALDHLGKYGDVFILTDSENPQYSYCNIKGVDAVANLKIEFEKFVLISQADNDSQNKMNNSGTEFITKTFGATSPVELTHNGLESYVEKSGFSTVDDWIKTLKVKDKAPEWSTGSKMFYLYHIQARSAFELQLKHEKFLEVDKPRKSCL